MSEFEIGVFENSHLAEYEYPQLTGMEITGENVILYFDPVYSNTVEIQTSIENLEHLSLTLD